MAQALLEPAFLARLDGLAVASRRRAAGTLRGERRSTRRGSSLEFADHRPYAEGDDLRHLDWHLYARLDDLFVKLFEAREDRTVQLYLDASASMRGQKLLFAQRLGAALGYLALAGLDRVAVAAFDARLRSPGAPLRGKNSLMKLLSQLSRLEAGGQTDFAAAVRATPQRRGGRVGVVISDFFDLKGVDEGLRRLARKGGELQVIHVLAPEEVDPPLNGDLTLVDRETGGQINVTVTPRVKERYRARVEAWSEDIEQRCAQVGAGYVRVTSDTSVEDLVLDTLRRRGWVG